jgi:hypothetical protein
MKLTTSKGHAYEVDWIDTVANNAEAFMQMADDRTLSDIVPEFDGLEWMKREDAHQGDKLFEGYSVLKSIKRVEPGIVILSLEKAGDN